MPRSAAVLCKYEEREYYNWEVDGKTIDWDAMTNFHGDADRHSFASGPASISKIAGKSVELPSRANAPVGQSTR
jgi:hypothetical protein